jgi:hypothetical protein
MFDPWPGQLPFILSGGGSRVKFYSDAFAPLEQKLAQNFTRWPVDAHTRAALGQGFEMIKFPVPTGFVLGPTLADDFDRLSVAHGLTYGVDDLMKITASIHADGAM